MRRLWVQPYGRGFESTSADLAKRGSLPKARGLSCFVQISGLASVLLARKPLWLLPPVHAAFLRVVNSFEVSLKGWSVSNRASAALWTGRS